MRITFVLPHVNMSGGIRVIAIYAELLIKIGHEVVLVSPPLPKKTFKQKIKTLFKKNVFHDTKQPLPSHIDGLEIEHRILDRFRPVIDSDIPDADVVIATWWETAEWVNELSDSKGVKVYFIQHHEIHEHLPKERCQATYKFPLHKIVIAKWLANVMQSEYGDGVVDIVPNAVDQSLFFAPERGKQPTPTVGFLYSPIKFKGVDITLKAVTELLEVFPQLRIIVFGTYTPCDDSLRKINAEFHHCPEQNQIRNLYAQCDVWMTASRLEGFNLPAMEAMACRTPVVSTKAGWPDEAVVNGYNGALVDVNDWQALAKEAASILKMNDKEWKIVSENAYSTVQNSNWDASTKLLEKSLFHACERVKNKNI